MQRVSRIAFLAAAVFSMSAHAQPATPGTTSAPAAVGTTAQTAAEANQKAVPRSDTGTLVRTAPSATERATRAMPAGTDAAAAGAPAATGSATMGTGSGSTRPARADRN